MPPIILFVMGFLVTVVAGCAAFVIGLSEEEEDG
jgi:hypothetical protein